MGVKDPWLRLTNYQTYYISVFFYKVDPVFVFIKSIKIGGFSRFGCPEIRKNRDPCGGKVSYQLTAGTGPGLGDYGCAADVIKVS